MPNHFSNEVDGQLKFYQDYLPLVDKTLKIEDVLTDYTDGIVNGNLIGFCCKVLNLLSNKVE